MKKAEQNSEKPKEKEGKEEKKEKSAIQHEEISKDEATQLRKLLKKESEF